MFRLINAIRREGVSSPFSLAIWSSIIFLVAWVFPPPVYESYVREVDFMFLDPYAFIFFFSCVISFLFGLRAIRSLRPTGWRQPLQKVSTPSPLLYIGIPLLMGIVICAVTLKILGSKINFVGFLASQEGSTIHNYGDR